MQTKLVVHFSRFARHERSYMFPRLFETRPWAFLKRDFPRPPLQFHDLDFGVENAYVEGEKTLKFEPPEKL